MSALVSALILASSGSASAQRRSSASRGATEEGDGARVVLMPWNALDGVDRPYRYVVRVTAEREVELAADRRLLWLELQPLPDPAEESSSRRRRRRPRRVRCTHSEAPRRTPSARVRTLSAGETYAEWIDLRMLCWGRSLTTLSAGATVVPHFGYRTGSRRTRWAVRAPEARNGVRDLEGPSFTFNAPASQAGQGEQAEEPPISVGLRAATGSAGSSPTFRASVRAEGEARRVYLRPDSFSFVIEGPTGEVICALPLNTGRPTSDLFTRLSRGRSRAMSLYSGDFCPRDSFEVPGIYLVTPRVQLIQSGEEWGYEAVTGTFIGEPQPLRVRGSRSGPYLEHPLPGAEESEPEGDS